MSDHAAGNRFSNTNKNIRQKNGGMFGLVRPPVVCFYSAGCIQIFLEKPVQQI